MPHQYSGHVMKPIMIRHSLQKGDLLGSLETTGVRKYPSLVKKVMCSAPSSFCKRVY